MEDKNEFPSTSIISEIRENLAKDLKKRKKSRVDQEKPEKRPKEDLDSNKGTTTSGSDNPRITLADYEHRDYLKDEDVVEKRKKEILKSKRNIIYSPETERILFAMANTSHSRAFTDFKNRFVKTVRNEKEKQTDVPYLESPTKHVKCKCGKDSDDSSYEDEDDDGNSSSTASSFSGNEENTKNNTTDFTFHSTHVQKEVERKRTHPDRVHNDMGFNEKGLGNDGAVCQCSYSSRSAGLRHGYYAGEEVVYHCIPTTSNSSKLYHYFLEVKPFPAENQISKTSFYINGEEFYFEGFSILTHEPLPEFMPRQPFSRWSIEYEFYFIEERLPEDCYTVQECDLLMETIFHDIFELMDFDLYSKRVEDDQACPIVHISPRMVAKRGSDIVLWSTKAFMAYMLTRSQKEFIDANDHTRLLELNNDQFIRHTNRMKQNILIRGDKKPCALRIDGFERNLNTGEIFMIHHSIRPQAYANTVFPKLQYLERKVLKMRYLMHSADGLVNKEDYENLKSKLDEMKNESRHLRQITVKMSPKGYRATGFYPDTVAHILMTVLATHHARYHLSLNLLERKISYRFNNRSLLELSLTHSTFKNNYGTNTDHAKTLILNCGYRKKYLNDDRNEKKKGIVNLVTIMGTHAPTATEDGKLMSPILHNERLEYLGDTVVEMIVSNHLYFMLTHHNEGGLATYRTSLVQNRNLATLAKNINLHDFIQFAHGVELCHEADFRHALANAFEAIMAAIYLDSGIDECDRIFSEAMYVDEPEFKNIWDHVNEHELKREKPDGDRDLADTVPTLMKFKKLEESLGIEFNNIRLLAKAFTRRNVPINELTKGHNQRLEWLGDTVLQLIVSDYLYRHFPYHHEGHLSLLRTSIVSNKTQSVICDDLGFSEYIIRKNGGYNELRMKEKADLVESFIGALYVDRGLEHCRTFIRICFLPRLTYFISNEKWNDPKSHLQQWCLTLRSVDNPTPAIPEYRVVRREGPTNTRRYTVAVYYRNKKLAIGEGQNVHTAELNAAENALAKHENSSFQKMKNWKKNEGKRKRRIHKGQKD